MINLVSLLTNRWNQSKIFIFNRNWSLINQSLNYFRYTEGFSAFQSTQNFNYLGNTASNKLSPNRTLSINIVERVLSIFFKTVGGLWGSILSTIPYSVFKVKSSNSQNSNNVVVLDSQQNFFLNLSKFSGGKNFYLSQGSSYSISTYQDVSSYWNKKFLFFKKNKLFNSFLFKASDFIYLNVYSNAFSKSLRVVNNFRVSNLIQQTNWNFYKSNKYSNFQVKNFFNFYFVGLRFFWLGLRFWVVGAVVMLLAFFSYSN